MRKIIYSTALKVIMVIVLTACITLGALTAVKGITDFQDEEPELYSFESDFSQSHYISFLLNEPEFLVTTAYHGAFSDENGNIEKMPSQVEIIIAENYGEIAQSISNKFEHFYYEDKLNYYVKWNDTVITNCGASSAEELMTGNYSYVKKDANGNVDRSYTNRTLGWYLEELNAYGSKSEVVIACNIKEEVAKEYGALWEKQESIVIGAIVRTGAFILGAVLALIYLLCVCGKNKDGEYKNMWIDNVWLEVHLAFACVAAFGAAWLLLWLAEAYYLNHLSYGLVQCAVGVIAVTATLAVITPILSVVRNLKTQRAFKTSIVLRILRWLWRICVKAVKWIYKTLKTFFKTLKRGMSKKTGALMIVLLFVYTSLIGIMGLCMYYSPMGLILGILLFVFASVIVASRAGDIEQVKKGVREIKSGNTAYKIAELKSEDIKALAEDVNDIARGLDESVAAKVKAERMKSELITNVSHDLKTPITSIISYAELLANTEGLSDEARDYAAVILKKGNRLKRLTQDLFDISKAHSGNEVTVTERLDLSLLIHQTLAEQEREIENSGLVFCKDIEKELYISADGRKLSRVIGNLTDNILKYALKGTRVFVSAKKKGTDAVVEMKNVSAYPLDFDEKEITARFVRGDESRSLDGNGLGLAIAKSYTELCGGSFEVIVDGDMFKVLIKFEQTD